MKIASLDELKNYIECWWNNFSDQKSYEQSSERGPNVANWLLQKYRHRDLSMQNLTNLDFRGANLSYVNLSQSIFVDVDFDGAEIFHCDLSNAQLKSAKNLNKAFFSETILCQVALNNLDLSGVEFKSTIITQADFTGTNFTKATFMDIDFSQASIKGAIFDQAKFDLKSFNSIFPAYQRGEIELKGIDIRHSLNLLKPEDKRNFIQTILPITKKCAISWRNLDLSGADLSNLDLSNLSLNNTNCSKANFNHSNLVNVDFSHANLTEATLCYTKLNKCKWDNCEVTNTDFSKSDGITGKQFNTAKNKNKCNGLSAATIHYFEKEEKIIKHLPKINQFFQPVNKRKFTGDDEYEKKCSRQKLPSPTHL